MRFEFRLLYWWPHDWRNGQKQQTQTHDKAAHSTRGNDHRATRTYRIGAGVGCVDAAQQAGRVGRRLARPGLTQLRFGRFQRVGPLMNFGHRVGVFGANVGQMIESFVGIGNFCFERAA